MSPYITDRMNIVYRSVPVLYSTVIQAVILKMST